MSTTVARTSTNVWPAGAASEFDPSLTYMADQTHFPAPLSPLYQAVNKRAFEFGLRTATAALNVPISDVRIAYQNHYHYQAFPPVIPADAAEARELGERAEATMQREIPRQMERWEGAYLPRIKDLHAQLAAIEFEGVPGREIPALLDRAVSIASELWAIRFEIGIPMLTAMQLYDEFYADLFGGDQFDAHALLIGLPSESVKAGAGLSDLAAAAKAAGLDKLLLSVPAEEALVALADAPIGEYYIAAIRDYLREYGLRQELFEFNVPTWQENPTIAISTIQAYLRSGHDARADYERMLKGAVAALNAARAQLAAYPEQVRSQFEAMVDAARAAYFLQEEHNFYIDQRGTARQRLLYLRLGERLVRDGALAKADDVFMLSLDELKLVAGQPLEEEQIGAVRMLVIERECELEQAAAITPPPFIGAPPAETPHADNPMDRAMMRFFGLPPQAPDAPNQLKGNAGSRGTARGIARVARTLDEAKALQPGEILVAITTMPAWAPLFGTAAALVTETGGPLSHGAIVAREYGIPAVVGAPGATQAIRTGQTITVDGTTGTVTIDDA
jgi:rifampicin phosphotransferase